MPKRPNYADPVWEASIDFDGIVYKLSNAPVQAMLLKKGRGWWVVFVLFDGNSLIRRIRPGRGVDPRPVAMFAVRQMLTALLAPYNKLAKGDSDE